MTKMITIGRIGRGAAIALFVVCWLLWSAVALRLDIDGGLLGVIWFGVPLAFVWALRWYWNRYRAGEIVMYSTNNFR